MKQVRSVVGTVGRVLLGAFVLWQGVFLCWSLLPSFTEAFGGLPGMDSVRNANDQTSFVRHHYAELTAQGQRWSLFAPDVWKELRFLDVELRWDDDGQGEKSVILPAKTEPENINAFLRLQGYRIQRYEEHVTPMTSVDPTWVVDGEIMVLFGDAEPQDDREPAWMAYPPEQAEAMLAYLRWRLADFRRTHPELPPPNQVLLWMHSYRLPDPPGPSPWRWEGPEAICLGRWLPASEKPEAKGKEP